MAYEKQTWVDYPSETTPISAERLNHMEDGIENAGESAGNLEIGFNDTPYAIQDEIAMMNINLHTTDEQEQEIVQSDVPCPGPDSFYQLKGMLESKIASTSDKYNISLTKDTTESLDICYKDGENVEYQYELESGNMPWVRYKLNNGYNLPDNITVDSVPVFLKSSFLGYDTNYIGTDDTICYAKYSSDKLPTYIFATGTTNMYLALALRSTSYSVYAYIIPINTSTHKIITNDYIGKRYANNQYVYYIFNLKYNEPSNSNDTTFTFNGGTSRPIFYNDGTTYQAYSSTGLPFVYAYVYGVDFDSLDLEAITANLHDGTSINYGYVYQDKDIASGGTTIPSDTYYLYQLDTDKYLAVLIYSSSGGIYVYATVLDTANHTNSASPELYGGSGSSPYIPMTLHFKNLKIIDDTVSSSRTTYSSAKIDQLIASLQAQINS